MLAVSATDAAAEATANVVSYLLGTPDSSRPAVLQGKSSITHSQLTQRCQQLASGLASKGIGRGDIVAIVGDNSIQWVVWYLGVMQRGAVALPLSGAETERLLRRALEIEGVRCILCQRKYAERIASVLEELPGVTLYVDDSNGLSGDWPMIPVVSTSDFKPVEVEQDDLAAIMMTSGSTGDPKGVAISHRNIEVNTRSILSYLHLQADDRMMVILPFYYCFGLSLLHTHLRAGASVVLNNSFMFPDKVVEELETRQCTGFAGVPSTFSTLLRRSRIAERSLDRLKHVQQAGGRMPVSVARELAVALGSHVSIFVMYGATEATARLSYLPPACFREKAGSIGIPIPGVRFEIRDTEGRIVLPGEVGELVAVGDSIASGYYKDPELTQTRFGKQTFFTGDLARVDSDGFYYIEGRKSEFIKNFGFRISPDEVEDIVTEHSSVAEAAAFGVPDEEAGEAIALCVVPRRGVSLGVDEIRQHCVRHLPNHKQPQHIHIVETLPKNNYGKLHRAKLASSIS